MAKTRLTPSAAGTLLAATCLTVFIPAPVLAQSIPSLSRMFDNEKTDSATPSVTFSSTVGGGGEFLQYEVQWDTVRGFIAADPAIGSARSWVDAGFTSLDNGADVDPFNSGDTIQFTFPAGALTDGQTYWWRVRSRRSDTLALSAWSTPRTFTVDTAQTGASQWHQTTSEQFVNDTLADAVTGRESPTLRVIDSGATSNSPQDIDAADIDGDGDTDVVTAAFGSDQFAWYESDGSTPPVWTLRVIDNNVTDTNGANDIEAADVDGDGDMDVVTAANIPDQFAWYENDGSTPPVWTLRVIDNTVANTDGAYDVEAVDLDGDGDTDVVTASIYSNQFAWYENDGSIPPVWTYRLIDSSISGPRDIETADVDGDGDTDVVTAASTSDQFAWYENDGSTPPVWTLRVIDNTVANTDYAASIDPVDLDGDGDMDVVTAAAVSDQFAWYENDGSSPPVWTLRVIDSTADADSAQNIHAVDFDGDGDTDVVTVSVIPDQFAWYENDGSTPPVWTLRVIDNNATNTNGAIDIDPVDLDGDGDTDVVTGANINDTFAWYEMAPHDVRQTVPTVSTNTGITSPTTAGTTWTNPTNAFSNDGSYAESSTATSNEVYSDFGLSIPAGATIDGIEVGINAWRNNTNRTVDANITLSRDGGTFDSSTYAQAVTVTADPAGDQVLGGSGNLWGLTGWTADHFSNTNFRVRIEGAIGAGGGQPTSLQLDHLWVRVSYTVPVVAEITGPLIAFADFPGPPSGWDTVTWNQGNIDGQITVAVLDNTGTPTGLSGTTTTTGQGSIDISSLATTGATASIQLQATLDDVDGAESGTSPQLADWTVTVAAAAFGYFKPITIDRSMISDGSCGATLADFPLLFSVTDPDLAHTSSGGNVASLEGYDIIFTGLDATTCGGAPPCTLDHEIERYVNTTGELAAWVRIPSLNTSAAASDTVISLYYGDSTITSPTENPAGVWDASYAGVWHLGEGDSTSPGYYRDSTANGEHGTLTDADGDSTATAGKIGIAYDFNGDADSIQVPGFSQYLTTAMTISGWVQPALTTPPDNYGYFGLRQDPSVDHSFYILQLKDLAGSLEYRFRNSAGVAYAANIASAVSAGTWAYVTLTYDGDTLVSYIDGQVGNQNTSATGAFSNPTYPLHIGQDGRGNLLDGTVDEVRVSDTARSACWIGASYNNQVWPDSAVTPTPLPSPSPGGGFYTVGPAAAADPILVTTGAPSVDAGDPYTLNLRASFCTPASWTIVWGDGAIETFDGNPSSVTHTYSAAIPSTFTYDILASAVCAGQKVLQNDLVVPSTGNDRLNWYDNTGAARTPAQTGPDYGLDHPQVIIGPDGNVYATGYNSNNVVRYDATTGAVIDEFVSAGAGGVSQAHGSRFGPDGHFYLASEATSQVLRYDGASGDYIDVFVTAGSGGLSGPTGLVFGPDGYLYVSGGANDAVYRYDGSTGAFFDEFVAPGSGGLDQPEDLVFGPDGHLYLISGGNDSVMRYDGGDGASMGAFVPSGSEGLFIAAGLSFGPEGHLYVGSQGTDEVRRFDGVSGAFIDAYVTAGLGGLNAPDSFTFIPGQQVKVTGRAPTNYRSIGTAGPYVTGLVDVTGSSDVVSGVGTSWMTNNRGRGDVITIPCPSLPSCTGGTDYTVLAVESETSLRLTEPYAGPTASDVTYATRRQFTTLQSWEACISGGGGCAYFPVASGDLVAEGRSEMGVAYKDSVFALPSSLVFDGSTTDPLHSITLTADPGNRHHGTAGAGVVIDSQDNDRGIVISDDFVTLEWLEAVRARGADGAAVEVIGLSGSATTLLQNLLIHDFYDPANPRRGIRLTSGTQGTVIVRNSMIWDGDMFAIAGDPGADLAVENCSIHGMPDGAGINADGSNVTVTNTIVTGTTEDFRAVSGAFTAASSNNVSSDNTAPGANPLWGVPASSVFAFIDPTGPPFDHDLHLRSAPNPALDSGVDLVPTAGFRDDVDGEWRPVGPGWDRGADERSTGIADLALTKDDGAATAVPGAPISYTITVTNNGPDPVTSVTVDDPVSAKILGHSSSTANGVFTPGTGEWVFAAPLFAGQSTLLRLDGTIDAAATGTLTNTATVFPPPGVIDTIPGNDSDSDIDTLTPQTDLEIVKTDDVDPIEVGNLLTYTLSVENYGPSDATGVDVTDTLVAEPDYESATPSQGACGYAAPTRTLTCNLGPIASGGSAVVTLVVRPKALGTLGNTASVAGNEPDPLPANNTSTQLTTVEITSDGVRFFTVTSTHETNVLEWLNPAGAYLSTEIVFRTDRFPNAPGEPGSTSLYNGGTAGTKDRLVHGTGAGSNNQTHYYAAFVHRSADPFLSSGRFCTGRPFDSSGPVRWAFSTGAFSITPPTVTAAAVVAPANDRALYAMERGAAGGEWPAGWEPAQLGGVVQARSSAIPLLVNGANPVVYLGAQDGNVYAVNGTMGGAAAFPWSPRSIAGIVQAAPAGIFSAWGGGHDYLLVGTRDEGADNALVALNPDTPGDVIGTFDNGGGLSGIGIISGMATVDYSTGRVYFTSRESPTGSNGTLWCLQMGPPGPVLGLVWQRALGDIDGSPVLHGGRVYVGSAAGGGTVHSIDAATGSALGDRTFVHGDGVVKGFVWPDRASSDLYFATSTLVWGIEDAGAPSMPNKFAGGISLGGGVTPSVVLFVPGSHFVYTGGSDGRLYEIDVLPAVPTLKSVVLGDGLARVGAPSLDWANDLVHVGTEAGIFYAVDEPLP